jgi:hypothetical protein
MWQGDDPTECRNCEHKTCPECGDDVMLRHEYEINQAINQREAELQEV